MVTRYPTTIHRLHGSPLGIHEEFEHRESLPQEELAVRLNALGARDFPAKGNQSAHPHRFHHQESTFMRLFVSILMCQIAVVATAQVRAQTAASEFAWPEGRRAAVSLSFDDARTSQVDTGLAVLDRLGAKATFYVVPVRVESRLAGWKKLVASGHEIGNHSLRHPCTGNFEWSREAALEDYTLDRMRAELIGANRRLKELLGVEPVTFAYPCGQTFVGRGLSTRSYVPLISELFLAGRGWLDETPTDPVFHDPAQVSGMSMDGMDFPEVKALVETARSAGQWLVLAGHEMASSGHQTTRIEMLERLIPYLQDPQNKIWFETVATVARYLSDRRGAE